MIAEIICEDCHSEISVYRHVVRDDLKYTKLAYLLDTKLKTEEDFNIWLRNKKENGTAYYKEDKLIIDGEEVLDGFQRWEQSGRVCFECGSKNCHWF